MVCEQGNGSLVTLAAKNGFVFLDNVATDQTQTSKNGDKEQYYIRGGIWDLVADFENKILIHNWLNLEILYWIDRQCQHSIHFKDFYSIFYIV